MGGVLGRVRAAPSLRVSGLEEIQKNRGGGDDDGFLLVALGQELEQDDGVRIFEPPLSSIWVMGRG